MKKKILFTTAIAALMAGTAGAQSILIPGGDMEAWNNLTVSGSTLQLEAPNGWSGSDSMVASFTTLGQAFGLEPKKQLFKSTDSHSGSFAAEIKTENLGDSIGPQPGALSNAQISIDIMALLGGGGTIDLSQILNHLTYLGGQPVNAQVDTVYAWVKTDPANADASAVLAMAMKNYQASDGSDSGVAVGQSFMTLTPSAEGYTEVRLPIIYDDPNAMPDYLVVVFTSSNIQAATKTEGNTLKVDDVSYSLKNGTGIRQPLFAGGKLLVYPVPASNLVYFNLNASEDPTQYRLQITDIRGRVIVSGQLAATINAENVEQWARGTYFYRLTNQKSGQQQQGKFILN